MHGEAPAQPDQPVNVPMLGEAVELAEILRPNWKPTNARLTNEVQEGDPEDGNPDEGQPDPGQEEVTLDSFDPTQIPEDADREWLATRHQQMLADYTRKTQGIPSAEERQEAEEARQVLAMLTDEATQEQMLRAILPADKLAAYYGQQQAPEEEFLTEEDRLERMQQELEETRGQFTSFLQQQQSVQEEQRQNEDLAAQIIELEDKVAKREFSDEEFDLITSLAYQRPNAKGEPDAKAAFDLLSNAVTRNRDAWVGRRKATPRRMASGTPASETVDNIDPEQRRANMLRAAEELQASQ